MARPLHAAVLCAITWLALAACSTTDKRAAEASAAAPPAPVAPAPPAPPAPMPDIGAMDASAGSGSLDAITVSGSRIASDSASTARAEPRAPGPLAAARMVRAMREGKRAHEAAKAEAEAAERALSTRRSEPAPRAGILTAADYDDLLNPTLYARYAERYLQHHGKVELPFVDTRQALRVRVQDSSGKPVPFAEVHIGNVRRATAADGSAVFFPALDGVRVPTKVSVNAPSPASARRTLELASLPSDRNITIELPIRAQSVQALDLLLVLDTTGSMGDELRYLQSELAAITDRLRQTHGNLDIRLGLIVYRDEGDEYVVRRFPFTSDHRQIREALAEQHASGGGDYPEAVDQALAAASEFEWRPQAVKSLLFVADAPPHADKTAASWKQAEALRQRGVHIVPVAASGVADEAQYLMRSMAAATQSRYLFLTDDSGVGLPHQDPDVPCYVVTHLDGLISRVLEGLVSGRRVEPSAEHIIRRVGDYDRGVCLPGARSTGGPKIAR